jgi:hypothetical protein
LRNFVKYPAIIRNDVVGTPVRGIIKITVGIRRTTRYIINPLYSAWMLLSGDCGFILTGAIDIRYETGSNPTVRVVTRPRVYVNTIGILQVEA